MRTQTFERLPIPRIVKQPEAGAWLAIGRTLFYAQVKGGLLPPPVKLGERAVGWPSGEIAAVVAARIAGANSAALVALVAELVAARKAGR